MYTTVEYELWFIIPKYINKRSHRTSLHVYNFRVVYSMYIVVENFILNATILWVELLEVKNPPILSLLISMIVHYDEAQLETKKLFTCGFDLEFFLIQVSIKKIKKFGKLY